MGRFRVGDKVIAVVRVGQIAIRNFPVYTLPALGLGLFDSPDFLGCVAGVKLIELIPQRSKFVVLSRCIYAVIDGDIANIVLRENDFDKFPGFQIIPAQAGKVFCYDCCHISGLHLTEHGLKSLTLEADPGKSIIHEKAGVQKKMFISVPL